MDYEVIVVGGSLAGAALAKALAEHGGQVLAADPPDDWGRCFHRRVCTQSRSATRGRSLSSSHASPPSISFAYLLIVLLGFPFAADLALGNAPFKEGALAAFWLPR
jgi:hypothetical protein